MGSLLNDGEDFRFVSDQQFVARASILRKGVKFSIDSEAGEVVVRVSTPGNDGRELGRRPDKIAPEGG